MALSSKTLSIVNDVEQRFAERTAQRERTVRYLKEKDFVEANGVERVEMRLRRLGCSAEFADELAVQGRASSSAIESVDPQTAVGLERVLGTNDLISVNFLLRGLQVAQAVHRVHLGAAVGRSEGFGTGFLVSSRLLLTNNHVLRNEAEAANALAEFNYQEREDGSLNPAASFRLNPDDLFITDPHLDYSLVAVEPIGEDGTQLEQFGWIRLIETQGKAMVGEFVNIIQHPGGEPKQLALRENEIVDLLEHFIHYQTDTAPGSSGSPVFNDQWEVVALHHSGVPNRNANGDLLSRDGRVWRPALGEHRIHWIANEGARISRVVASIKQERLQSAAQRRMREGLFSEEPPHMRLAVEGTQTAGLTSAVGLTQLPPPRPDEVASWGAPPESS